ncbi:DUF1801 domain-containing protein [Maritalea porphyrae]|jgi:hypothetical protein|uniref:DUF1801 domain-containing protein n=1 Tax=Maritalea porphyrae TaxID=880732 RepID=UPI0022AF8BCD|nr:DUF1801 domain-containing protein [Maritalea porphyrae]MCZ4271514.1 DUF1801 domain-containing protein [Maritalea porphyrae]
MPKPTDSVDAYIADKSEVVQTLLVSLRELVNTHLPDSKEGMKWGAPVYKNKHDTPVVYLYGGKDHANLGFVHGAKLDDPENLLEGKGKDGRHIKIYAQSDIIVPHLIPLLHQCADIT